MKVVLVNRALCASPDLTLNHLGRYMRSNFFILVATLFCFGVSVAQAGERYYVSFDLSRDGKIVDRGNDYVTARFGAWSNGYTSSYLKLRCRQGKSGEVVKTLSTVDHFSGTRLTHRLVDGQIEVTVLRTRVKNRRQEIHDLPEDRCEELAPIVSTISQSYTFPARVGFSETKPFGETLQFKFTVQTGNRKKGDIE